MPSLSRRAVLKRGVLLSAGAALATTADAQAASGERTADVCVVGAGLAGLVAARRLSQAGASVIVLEANDRVGGRTVNLDIGGGHITEGGGEWVGAQHDRIKALARELGVRTFKTYVTGKSVIQFHGTRQAYTGAIPPLSIEALTAFATAQGTLEAMAATVPLDAPWSAPGAAQLDATTYGAWLDEHVSEPDARLFLTLFFSITFGQDPHNTSLLFALFFIRSNGGIDQLVNTAGGEQDSRIAGGSQILSLRMAKALGKRLILDSPVTSIDQRGRGDVVVRSDRAVVRCRRVVLAMTPRDADRIGVRPQLPVQRTIVQKNWQTGTGFKAFCIYDEPFWRKDGLNGQGLSDLPTAVYTADNSPESGGPGVLLTFLSSANSSVPVGLTAAQLASSTERRKAVTGALAQLFGPKAAKPRAYLEHDWTREPYIAGCESPRAPGMLTQYRSADRDPIGRIHYAGTETSPISEGYMDGAVRSGERVAKEIAKRL